MKMLELRGGIMDTDDAKAAVKLRDKRELTAAIDILSGVLSKCLSSASCSQETLADLYNERGFTKYLYVDFDGAIADYTLALEQHKKAVFYYNRGLIHYRLVTHSQHTDIKTIMCISYLSYNLARFQAAYEDTSNALKLQPEFPDALRCQQQSKIDGKL